ncbi:MAG: signal peptidase I [Ruminococcaceae bacterium]|nr:signal peptidase I [Oscillospiraceae bacterium]
MQNGTNNFNNGFIIDTSFVDNELPEVEKLDPKKELVEWLGVVASALIIVVILFGFVFRVAVISGDSMKNTLFGGDVVVITNLNCTPKEGDIVVVSRNAENSPESMREENGPIIKRVIATEFQEVNIDFETGIVYVDNVPLNEPYISTPTVDQYDVKFPVTVPEGCIFVLGDNRGVSLDSRSSRIGDGGMIDTRYVLGHAVYRVFPFNRMGGLDKK